jgi:signal transduction histidine kinase
MNPENSSSSPTPNPLATGNRWQRRYYAWALPYYERMAPDLRAQVEATDIFLYTRQGRGLWLGLLGAWGGISAGLWGAGMPWWLAMGLSALGLAALVTTVLAAWFNPGSFSGQSFTSKRFLVSIALGALGGIAGFSVGDMSARGHFDAMGLAQAFVQKFSIFLPALAITLLAMMGLQWGVARVRREVQAREIKRLRDEQERLRLASERDQATAAATQARLSLLQGQIQPHFLFNTLATLQHWVDNADARAPALLRAITAFLRGSTEALGREQVRLGDEAALVQHYLHIMQARLGQRLRYGIEIAPEAASVMLPPGLLLTLVENALEHGVEPSLSGAEVKVRAGCEAGRCWVEVQDDGAGLAPGAQDGVGLANSRARLVHAFGSSARLGLQAAAPHGCVARIELPLPQNPSAA